MNNNTKSFDELSSEFESMIKQLEKDKQDLHKFSEQNKELNRAIARGDSHNIKKISGEMEVPTYSTQSVEVVQKSEDSFIKYDSITIFVLSFLFISIVVYIVSKVITNRFKNEKN